MTKINNIPSFRFKDLDTLRIDLITSHGNTEEIQSLLYGFIELYKDNNIPISLSTSKNYLKWI